MYKVSSWPAKAAEEASPLTLPRDRDQDKQRETETERQREIQRDTERDTERDRDKTRRYTRRKQDCRVILVLLGVVWRTAAGLSALRQSNQVSQTSLLFGQIFGQIFEDKCRHVVLPKDIAKLAPNIYLMSESE